MLFHDQSLSFEDALKIFHEWQSNAQEGQQACSSNVGPITDFQSSSHPPISCTIGAQEMPREGQGGCTSNIGVF